MTRLRDVLADDAFRYTGEYGAAAVSWAMAVPGFRFTVAMRACGRARARGALGLPQLLAVRPIYEHLRVRFGFDVPYVTSIGPGLHIAHFGGLVVNLHSVIGSCVNLTQGVVIGRVNTGRKKGVPTIGDRVWIGPHAVVVGGITIGADARIAPNAFVDFDVPPRAIVVGNPARVVGEAKTRYVNNIPPGLFADEEARGQP
jgi:serine O-acetyltransferase